jgi:cytochrome b subunit of formate dehydrogenase
MTQGQTAPNHPAQGRRIHWLNVLTVISAAILIGVEVFGLAFAGSWAITNLFGFDATVRRILDGIFMLCGVYLMVQFVRNAQKVEPFVD